MDELMLADFRGAVLERKILFAVLERVSEVHALARQAPRDDIARDVDLFVFGVIDLARLRALRHEVRQGAMVVVEDYDTKAHPQMVRHWRLGPPGFATPETEYWKRLTRMHLGTGADAFVGEEDFLQAVGESDPEANLYALAHELDLPLLPFASHEDRQIHKVYAPKTIARCEKLSLDEMERLDAALDLLLREADSRRASLFRKNRLAPRLTASNFDKWLLNKGLGDVGPRIIADGAAPTLIPLLFRHGKNYVFAPRQVLVFRRMLQTYAADKTAAQMSARAGKAFEFLVAGVLKRTGLTTSLGARELVGVSLGKKDPHEIDSLAFDSTRVYLTDAKYEMEPPGAWSPEYVQRRTSELEAHRKKLLAKVPHWEARLREPRPALRVADGSEVTLSGPLLPGRTLVPLVVSARLEPILALPDHIVSFVPPKAAEVMQRYVPMNRFQPIWTGIAPP